MKIIFSRKGYDSAAGGIPSPIFPDGSFCSLPIPSEEPPRLKDVRYRGMSLGLIVPPLARDPHVADEGVHLDPDLDALARPRKPGWRPCFGQTSTSQTHLANHEVGQGDLFLFFGWFRRVTGAGRQLRYDTETADIHALFGWLQVGSVFQPGAPGCRTPTWASDHPHVRYPDYHGGTSSGNTLYVASERLCLPGPSCRLPGGGTFPRFSSPLQLTAPGHTRSTWRLPACFHPAGNKVPLSYHKDMSRWQKDREGVLLRTVGRGQEFVLDATDYPGVLGWVRGMFDACGRQL